MLANNQLSVDFDNMPFGEIIEAVSQKAGFKVHVTGGSAALAKKVTTKYTDLELEEGIKRLFSLVKESNYLINYDTKGNISELKIINSKASSTGAVAGIPQTSSGTRATAPVPFRAWRSRRVRAAQEAAPPLFLRLPKSLRSQKRMQAIKTSPMKM